MKKYLMTSCLIMASAKAMVFENKYIEERMRYFTPLGKAVVIDDEQAVRQILFPDQSNSNNNNGDMVSKLFNAFKGMAMRQQQPIYEELRDQIISPVNICRSDRESTEAGSLIHLAAGKLAFRILEYRHLGYQSAPFGQDPHTSSRGAASDERNYKEIGTYDPTDKAKILELLLDYLSLEDRKKVINKPDARGFTPMHIAVISAAVCTKNGYNAPLIHEHLRAIDILKRYQASVCIRNAQNKMLSPYEFTHHDYIETFFRQGVKYPLDIMHFFRYAPGMSHPTEYYDYAIADDIQWKIRDEVKKMGEDETVVALLCKDTTYRAGIDPQKDNEDDQDNL